MSDLSQLEREAGQIIERLRKLELIDVASAAKLLKATPQWVRANLPIVVLSQRRSRVRRTDVEAFQAKRTIHPNNNHFSDVELLAEIQRRKLQPNYGNTY